MLQKNHYHTEIPNIIYYLHMWLFMPHNLWDGEWGGISRVGVPFWKQMEGQCYFRHSEFSNGLKNFIIIEEIIAAFILCRRVQ